MDNIQNCDSRINIPLAQTYRSYIRHCCSHNTDALEFGTDTSILYLYIFHLNITDILAVK
jgi:hypothetical protein